jgi:HSP20 family protein
MSNYYLAPRVRRRFQRYPSVYFNGGRSLPLDVQVEDEEYVITAAVPGFEAEDVHIEILDDVLTLRAETEQEKVEENGNGKYMLREITRGSFSRSLRLPHPADASKAEAKIENGLLTVRIPKSEEARPKKIEVKAK